MVSPTLNGQSLGSVSSINFSKTADLETLPMPLNDSDGTITFDYGGVVKKINVSGKFTGNTTSAVKTFIDNISAIIDGEQTNSINFVSDELGTISVKIESYNVTWNIPSNNADYSIQLVEGD